VTTPWWAPKPAGTTHEVSMLCACPSADACVTEKYLADVRILRAELDAARAASKEEL
jgi:hypothetical protein